jgi:hypothetical protein
MKSQKDTNRKNKIIFVGDSHARGCAKRERERERRRRRTISIK